jgi:hypothetical protein
MQIDFKWPYNRENRRFASRRVGMNSLVRDIDYEAVERAAI